jgi:polyisoprenoid-binding protein YceI
MGINNRDTAGVHIGCNWMADEYGTCLMPATGLLRIILLATLALVLKTALGVEPCSPFEGGQVDAGLLQLMRQAAENGRLYRVDPVVSKVGFCVRHFPGQEFRGEFTNIVGGFVFPPILGQQSQALLLIHTTSLSSENTDLLPLVAGQQFLDTSSYPDILFVGHTAHWQTDLQGHIHGDLTLRGVTRPVTFEVVVRAQGYGEGEHPARIHLQGRSQVERRGFDMKSHRFFVSDTVRLCLDVELVHWK